MTQPADNIIGRMQKYWKQVAVLSDTWVALGITFVFFAATSPVFQAPWWVDLSIFFLAMMFAGIRHNFWQHEPADIARYLNSWLPQVQESAQLLFKPAGSLSLLEQLQLRRIEHTSTHTTLPPFLIKRMGRSAVIFFGSVALAAPLYLLISFSFNQAQTDKRSAVATKQPVVEKRMTGVLSVELQIRPPAYTGLRTIRQPSFTIQTAEGAEAVWQIATSNRVQALQLLFNNKESLSLHATDSSGTIWTGSRKLMGAGFYQVNLEGKLSDMYMIDLVKDQPPVVHIQRPKQYTTIDFGEPQRIGVYVNASDDYGLSQAFMIATIASGSGEAVKFKEQRLPLTGTIAGRRETTLQRALDLRALGMKPGDELYYYVSATDKRAQETRSDVYTIILPDTAQLMEIEGLTNSVNLKLEYFRSQRQIIIETEQLLKDKDTITATAFNNKSNNLGIDQKLLRLRYGKFLGEENENEIGGEHEHEGEGHEEHEQTVFGDASKLMEQYTHQHDNAEDATFFDPKQKAQLRATLSEMWKAELQLRLYKPQAALPFEYKALRLLKDLQQQSRSYVAKAAYKTTPLRPEKRLTADLSKIVQPVTSQTVKAADTQDKGLREAAGILEELKSGMLTSPAAAKTLQTAARHLGTMAISKPSLYLSSFEALKRVLAAWERPASITAKDINLAEKGLQDLVNRTGGAPRKEGQGVQQNLSQQYFKNLQQTNR